MGKQYLNGVLYGTGEIIKFSPYIYSFEEREIGVWTDGKPLYEKTIDCGALPNNTSKLVEHNINNIDYIANVFGTSQNTLTKDTLPLSYAHRSQISSQVQIDVTNTYVILYTAKDNTSYNKTYITIQYTKTTDNPGSGRWTMKGDIAHHYSTSEQIVGTWIDGKPLYEKTFSTSTPVVATDGTYVSKHTDITSLNVETVVDYDIMMYNASLSQYIKIMYMNNSNYMVKGYVDIGNSRFTILCNASAFSDKQAYVTIKYTKTTD